MEAAKPISISTPKDELNLSFVQYKEYNLTYNKKEYLIKIGKISDKEKIGFKVKEISSEQKIIYDIYLNLEELQSISKSFRVFDNIDEALTSIEDIFQEKNANIKIV